MFIQPVSSIIEHMEKPRARVKTCSDCSKEMIDGKRNIAGLLHRMAYTNWLGQIDCCRCPVHLESVRTGEFQKILNALDGEK